MLRSSGLINQLFTANACCAARRGKGTAARGFPATRATCPLRLLSNHVFNTGVYEMNTVPRSLSTKLNLTIST